MESASLSEYQDALRDVLLYVMHHPRLYQTKPSAGTCRVLWALPQLVDLAAKAQHDPSVDEGEAIRAHICSRCAYQDANGYCPLRTSGECCLSREEGRVIAVIRRISQRQDAAPDPALKVTS